MHLLASFFPLFFPPKFSIVLHCLYYSPLSLLSSFLFSRPSIDGVVGCSRIMHPTQYLLKQQHRQEHPYQPYQSSLLPTTPSSPSPSPSSTSGAPPLHPILHFQSLFASMDLYAQQSSSSPRPLSLIREEADQAQTKSHTTSADEMSSSSDMDDVLLLDVMQASTSPVYSQFDPLLPLDNKTAARHQESAGLLAALSAERLGLSSMALNEFPVSPRLKVSALHYLETLSGARRRLKIRGRGYKMTDMRYWARKMKVTESS